MLTRTERKLRKRAMRPGGVVLPIRHRKAAPTFRGVLRAYLGHLMAGWRGWDV